jgi:hypothetical protein
MLLRITSQAYRIDDGEERNERPYHENHNKQPLDFGI